MKRIIIIHPHFYYFRGASKFVLEISRRLQKLGFEVIIVTIGGENNILKKYNDLRFVFLGGAKTSEIFFWINYPLFQIRLNKILKKIVNANTIVFCQVMPANWWAFIYKIFYPKTKLVWMCQEPSAFIYFKNIRESLQQPFKFILNTFWPVLAVVDKWLAKNIDYIFANSKFSQALVEEIYNRKADLIAYPGIALDDFKIKRKKENFFLSVSRLDYAKRIDITIEAFSKLPETIKNEYRYLIIGEGNDKARLIKIVNNFSLEDRIMFLGSLSDKLVRDYIGSAKMLLFPTPSEAFGIVPVEANAAGTFVIAHNSGGVKETVEDGETGYLANNLDPEEFASLIIKALEEKKYNKILNKDLSKYTWDVTSAKIANFFRKI